MAKAIGSSLPDEKSHNLLERAMEKIEAVLNKETHGNRNYIDETTPLSDVKAPNLYERAKEEIEALVEAFHSMKQSQTKEQRDESAKAVSNPEILGKQAIVHDLIEMVKEKIEAISHHEKSASHNHKETHGRRDDIDENTPIDEVKGPSILERAKEELEALVETIHLKKKPSDEFVKQSPEEEKAFWSTIGRWLEKVCSRSQTKRD